MGGSFQERKGLRIKPLRKKKRRRWGWSFTLVIGLYLVVGGAYLSAVYDSAQALSFPAPPSVGAVSPLFSALPAGAPSGQAELESETVQSEFTQSEEALTGQTQPEFTPSEPIQPESAQPEQPSSEQTQPEEAQSAPDQEEQPEQSLEEAPPVRRVKICAHRGDSLHWPENTLSAFQSAVAQGADYVELDVQSSSDGELFVFHDEYMKRITGYPGRLWEYTAAQLSEMDAGAFMGEQFAGTRIPTLTQALSFCRGQIRVNVEIKETAYEIKHPIAARVVQIIEELDMADQCVVTAYTRSTLNLVKRLNPEIRTSLLCDLADRLSWDVPEADELSVYARLLTPDFVNNAHAAGKRIIAWTADTQDEVRRLAALGVDMVVTNDPGSAALALYGEDGYFTAVG